tara:strand:- start:992 stop:1486 length:495 start_codon:yes stop_codon:yes gene_type:complete
MSGPLVSVSKKIIDVTPTLHGSAYNDGDALFNYQEIPNAVIGKGGCSKLINVTVNSKKASSTPMEIMLLSNAQSLESSNDPMNITAAEGAAAGFLGWVEIPDDAALDMGDFMINMPAIETQSKGRMPFLLQAAPDSTSVYFSAIIGGAVTYGASDLTFRFHIEL